MAASSSQDLEFGWQQSQQPSKLFESSHLLNVRHTNATESSARKRWLEAVEQNSRQDGGNSKAKGGLHSHGTVSFKGAGIGSFKKPPNVSKRAARCANAHAHGRSAERHSDDDDSENEANEQQGWNVEEPFVMWTPFVPPENQAEEASPRTKKRNSQSHEAIEKEIGVKRLWAKAHKKAQVRMNEFRHQKSISDATGNVQNFLVYHKSQQSVKRLQGAVLKHEVFTSSTRYKSLVNELQNPAKALQAFEDSVDYESQCYFTQLSDALVPLAQNAKKRQAETQQLREEMQENEQNELMIKINMKEHSQVHKDAKELMDDGKLRLLEGVANSMEAFVQCAKEIANLRRDILGRLAYYGKYWDEMGELERRHNYIQGIITEVEEKAREIERKERAKMEALEDNLKQLQRQADLQERQCEEERLRSGCIFSWIVAKVEERQFAHVQNMLATRYRRQQREIAYQKRAVVFRKSCLEREVRQLKISLGQAQKKYTRDRCVANVLDLRMRSLEASGLMLELQLRKREITHEGCVFITSEDDEGGLFQLVLREMEVQLQWFGDRCQPWEFCRNTLRVLRQPPLTTPLSLLRCSRQLIERWQAQERLIIEIQAKSLKRRDGSSIQVPQGRRSRLNSLFDLPAALRDALETNAASQQAEPVAAEDDSNTSKPQGYTPSIDLRRNVEELIQQRKQEEESKKQGDSQQPITLVIPDLVLVHTAKRAFKGRKARKSVVITEPTEEHTEDMKAESEEHVSGRPSCLNEMANFPRTQRLMEWVEKVWARLHGHLTRIALPSLQELVSRMDELFADLQEARDVAETSIYWITEGSRGPGVFSDLFLRDLSWLMRLVDRIAERVGTMRAVVEMLADVTSHSERERGPVNRLASGSMQLLRSAKPLVNHNVLEAAESWQLRLMKALHAHACLHGACNSALRWYCGKFYAEDSAELNEISRGLNILRRLLHGPTLVNSGALDRMLSPELFAEIRIALKLALQREEPQAYESAMLAMMVLETATAEDSIGTTFPKQTDLPEGMGDDGATDADGNTLRKQSVPMIMLGIGGAQVTPPGEEDGAGSKSSSSRESQTADELLFTWSNSVADTKDPSDLMGTASTAMPNSTMESIDLCPLSSLRFKQTSPPSSGAGGSAGRESVGQEERRIDPKDGVRYTLQHFKEVYGDDWEQQWQSAERRIDPSDGVTISLQQFKERYGDDWEQQWQSAERRIDPNDGVIISLQQFKERYGDDWEQQWQSAERRVDPNDGSAYTLQQFKELYGDDWEQQWQSAKLHKEDCEEDADILRVLEDEFANENPDDIHALNPSEGPSRRQSQEAAADPARRSLHQAPDLLQGDGSPEKQDAGDEDHADERDSQNGLHPEYDHDTANGAGARKSIRGSADGASDGDAADSAHGGRTSNLANSQEDADVGTGSDGRRLSAASDGSGLDKLSAFGASSEDANEPDAADVVDYLFQPNPRELARCLLGGVFRNAGERSTPDSARTSVLNSAEEQEATSSASDGTADAQGPADADHPASAATAADHGKRPGAPHATHPGLHGTEPHADSRLVQKRHARMHKRGSVLGFLTELGIADPQPQPEENLDLSICGHKSGADDHGEADSAKAKRRSSTLHMKPHSSINRQATTHQHDRHFVHSTTKGHLIGMHGEGAEGIEHSLAIGGASKSISFAIQGHHLEESDAPMPNNFVAAEQASHSRARNSRASQKSDGEMIEKKLLNPKSSASPRNSSSRNHANTPNGSASSSADSGTDDEKASASPDQRRKVLEALSSHHWEKKLSDGELDSREHEFRTSVHGKISRRGTARDAGGKDHHRDTTRGSHRLSAMSSSPRRGTAGTVHDDSHRGSRRGTGQNAPWRPGGIAMHKSKTLQDVAHGFTPHNLKAHQESGEETSLSVLGQHTSDANDLHRNSTARPGADAGVCSFADLAARKLDSPKGEIKDELMANFLNGMLNDVSKPKEPHKDINGRISHWLAKIEPEVASSTIAEYKAYHQPTDPDSSATTATPDTLGEDAERHEEELPSMEGAENSKVLFPRKPLVAPGDTMRNTSPKKRRAVLTSNSGTAGKAGGDDQAGKKASVAQPRASTGEDAHMLEGWLHDRQGEQIRNLSWLTKMREDWQAAASRHEAKLAAPVDVDTHSSDIHSSTLGYTSSRLDQIRPDLSGPAPGRREAATVLPSGRMCVSPSAQVYGINMSVGRGDGTPGAVLKTKPTLRTEIKDLQPAAAEPWTPISAASSSRSPPKRRRRQIHDAS